MYYRLFLKLLNNQEKRRFAWIFFSMILSSFFESVGLSLIIPYIGIISKNEATLEWFDTYIPLNMSHTELITLITAIFFVLITIKFVLQVYVNWESSRFPYVFYRNKAEQIFKRYLNQSYLNYIKGNTGIFVKNCTTTIEQSSNALLQYLKYLSAGVTSLFLFGLILIENFWISSSIILLFCFLGYVIYKLVKNPQKQSGKEKEYTIPKIFQTISDSFLVFKEIKLYNKQNRFFSIFNHYLQRLAKAHERSVFFPTLPPIIIEYFAVIVLLVVVLYFISYQLSLSGLIAPLIFYGVVGRRLLPSINLALSQHIQIQHFIPALQCLRSELEKPLVENFYDIRKIPFTSSLKFLDIHFSYEKGVDVLKGVNFEIKKNTSVAFVGPSGAGKSTIVKILISLIEPTHGQFMIDDKVYGNLSSWKHHIGYVPQDIALIEGTILENITLYDEKIDNKQLKEAITMAQLDKFLSLLPMGIDTHIGERGIKLSGGQKQRVGIARALYQDPDILLFDEATSSLDNISESLIAQTIRDMGGKKTIIAIAHRLTTVQDFDSIYVLNHGKIVANGIHDELLINCPLYESLTKPPTLATC